MNSGNRYDTGETGELQTVLVVDDDAMVRSFEAELLSTQGYKVLQAESAAEALRLAGTETIHLLLTDFLMPDLDGLELTRRFRCVQPETPVLMVSGSLGSTDNRIENLARFELLTKPFELDELLHKVRTLIQAEASCPIRKT